MFTPSILSEIPSIATPADRAWQRLRCAILINLRDPSDPLRAVIEGLRREFLQACSEEPL